jgi:hypothetical protein
VIQDVTARAVSPEGLKVQVAHRRNPYRYMLTDEQLEDILLSLALRRAGSIWENHTAADLAPRGQYPQPFMGFVLPNAAAKAGTHRRFGHNNGEAVLVDQHRLGTGGFRYGHSANVRGQIAAASAQNTDQDLFEAAQLAGDFVDVITERHLGWEKQHGPGEWLSADSEPADEYREMVAWYQHVPFSSASH